MVLDKSNEKNGKYRNVYIEMLYLIQINQQTRYNRAGRPDPDQQHCYHHAPTVKPEAATAFVELLMMGVKTPETC
jgi:hypothetical protein